MMQSQKLCTNSVRRKRQAVSPYLPGSESIMPSARMHDLPYTGLGS